ncbi:MAG TPA: DnaB-like helicase C-terminal domain-containing protein [Rhizobacter sp.]
MSHGIKLLLAFCEHETGFKEFLRLAPSADEFRTEAEKVVFGFVADHTSKFGAVPKWATVVEEGKKQDWGFVLPAANEAPEPPAYYHEKVIERRIHYSLKDAGQQLQNLLNNGNPLQALDFLSNTVQKLQLRQYQNQLMNYATDAAGVIKADLMQMALGTQLGLNFGWPYLDGMTGGLGPGDVVSIIGRPAQGKTFVLLYGAYHHWNVQQGIPLVISMEMRNTIITQRLAAMDSKIALTHIKTGQLAKKQYQSMMAKLQGNAGRQPFYIVDGRLATTVTQVKMLINQLKPSSVWIDGAYLMSHENKKLNRWEKVTDNAERLKGEIAEGLGLPTIISYQFNRMATQKKHGPPGVEDIAYTDAIGQLSSLVLGMMQEESIETMRKRTISILKGRSGEIGQFDINWSFKHPDAMNFSQWVEPTIAELSYM